MIIAYSTSTHQHIYRYYFNFFTEPYLKHCNSDKTNELKCTPEQTPPSDLIKEKIKHKIQHKIWCTSDLSGIVPGPLRGPAPHFGNRYSICAVLLLLHVFHSHSQTAGTATVGSVGSVILTPGQIYISMLTSTAWD